MADTTLQSFSKYIDSKLVEPLRRVLVGPKVVSFTRPAGFGVSAVEWHKITDMADGEVAFAFGSGNEDDILATATTQKIPVYYKDFKMDRRAYEAYRAKGVDIDTSIAQSAAFVAAKVQDTAILDGVSRDGTNYDIDGLYQGAGNDFNTAKDFGTAGNATDAVAGALDKLQEDDVPVDVPMNLILARTQYFELLASRNSDGVREYPEVEEMLNGGKIIPTNVLSSGTGMILPAPPALDPYVDFFLAQNWKTEVGFPAEHPNTGDLVGRVYSAGILRIKQSNAICKLSNI